MTDLPLSIQRPRYDERLRCHIFMFLSSPPFLCKSIEMIPFDKDDLLKRELQTLATTFLKFAAPFFNKPLSVDIFFSRLVHVWNTDEIDEYDLTKPVQKAHWVPSRLLFFANRYEIVWNLLDVEYKRAGKPPAVISGMAAVAAAAVVVPARLPDFISRPASPLLSVTPAVAEDVPPPPEMPPPPAVSPESKEPEKSETPPSTPTPSVAPEPMPTTTPSTLPEEVPSEDLSTLPLKPPRSSTEKAERSNARRRIRQARLRVALAKLRAERLAERYYSRYKSFEGLEDDSDSELSSEAEEPNAPRGSPS
jgi:hypothetical protein